MLAHCRCVAYGATIAIQPVKSSIKLRDLFRSQGEFVVAKTVPEVVDEVDLFVSRQRGEI